MQVNNHIHTTYSFSPYSPTQAVEEAIAAGLKTVGLMDHDSIGGAKEFIKAGKTLGIATTIGVECRVRVDGTPLEGRFLNNPDQKSIMYMAIHAIPHKHIDKTAQFFAPLQEQRNQRNILMVENLNNILPWAKMDFQKDVYAISMAHQGGTITERHIMYALAKKIQEKYNSDTGIIDFCKEYEIPLTQKQKTLLEDMENPYITYDLLGVLKSYFIPKIYVEATSECLDVKQVLEFSDSIDAISAYAYLGDVEESVTGDKKKQVFEDSYLDLLFETIHHLGFKAVTYMPSRNTMEQLMRVRDLCERYNFMQISGEDINSPRQSFVCDALNNPIFDNLIKSAWVLITESDDNV